MWAQIVNASVGIWLMVAPNVLGFNKSHSDVDHMVGPIIFSFAIIALAGCTRGVGKWNIVLGIALFVSPPFFKYTADSKILNDVICACIIIFCSFFLRKSTEAMGGGWSALWRDDVYKTN